MPGYLAEGNDRILKYLIYLMALLSFIQGIYAISGGKFIRYDPGAKRIKFYGLGIIERSVRFDKLLIEGNDLYREINSRRRYINLQRYQCNKEDLKKFMDAVKQQT